MLCRLGVIFFRHRCADSRFWITLINDVISLFAGNLNIPAENFILWSDEKVQQLFVQVCQLFCIVYVFKLEILEDSFWIFKLMAVLTRYMRY